MYIKLLSANVIQAGQRNFISADDNYYKNEAVWVAAINELLNYGLIEDVGYEGSMFKLTLLGFDTADAIIAVHGSVAGASG